MEISFLAEYYQERIIIDIFIGLDLHKIFILLNFTRNVII
jgi:hypothetical protein